MFRSHSPGGAEHVSVGDTAAVLMTFCPFGSNVCCNRLGMRLYLIIVWSPGHSRGEAPFFAAVLTVL